MFMAATSYSGRSRCSMTRATFRARMASRGRPDTSSSVTHLLGWLFPFALLQATHATTKFESLSVPCGPRSG